MGRSASVILMFLWTMWIRTQSPTADSWNPAPGFSNQAKCQASIQEKLNTWRQFKDAVFSGNSVTFTGNNGTMSYLCLPDSEDPRKPPKPAKPQT